VKFLSSEIPSSDLRSGFRTDRLQFTFRQGRTSHLCIMEGISAACCPSQCGKHCFNVCACGSWCKSTPIISSVPLETRPSCPCGKDVNEARVDVKPFYPEILRGNWRFTRLSGFATQPRTRKISHPVYLCRSSKKRLSRDVNRSTALRSWAVLALEQPQLVSDPSVTTSRGHVSLPIRFLFDATTEISILVVCLVFHQPIVQS